MSLISRIAKLPIPLPAGVTVSVDHAIVTVKGPKATVSRTLLVDGVVLVIEGSAVQVTVARNGLKAISGTVAAQLKKMIEGVTTGFITKLELVGVGYRAQIEGRKLNLTLGFSHPVAFSVPEGITIETPTPTEVLIKGSDNDLIGQVAATIRRYRQPEPYKGKGIRYAGEAIVVKEMKKK